MNYLIVGNSAGAFQEHPDAFEFMDSKFTARIWYDDTLKIKIPIDQLNNSPSFLSHYDVTNLIHGYTDTVQDLNYIQYCPTITSAKIMDSQVKDISALRYAKNLSHLTIDRPSSSFNMLGSLQSLVHLYLDDWMDGTESIAKLEKLKWLFLQKPKVTDLSLISRMMVLQDLQINRGNLKSLDGIPNSIKTLELTEQWQLNNLDGLQFCEGIQKLTLESLRLESVKTLETLTNITHLKIVTRNPLDMSILPSFRKLEFLSLKSPKLIIDIGSLKDFSNLQRLFLPKEYKKEVKKDIPSNIHVGFF